MPEKEPKKVKNYQLRAKMPKIFRVLTIAALCVTIAAVGIGFYLAYGRKDFRMKGLPANLSEDVVAEVSGFESRESENGKLVYYIKADKAKTFTDEHRELENVFLQVFDETGEKFDVIKAEKAIYIPDKENSKIFTAYFAGDVDIATRNDLKVKTDNLTYKKETEIAEAEEYIEFSRENISGNSVGAIVDIKNKNLELLSNVEISAKGGGEGELAKIEQAKITAGHAYFDQTAEKIVFDKNVSINIVPNASSSEVSQPTDIRANRATAFFTNKEINKIDLSGNVEVYQKPKNGKWTKTRANRAAAKINKELKTLELFENVDIETTASNDKPTKIKTNYAIYTKDADKFELRNGVEIITVEDDKPTKITSNEAVYEQTNGKILLFGNAQIVQGNDLIKGDKLFAQLFPNKKLKYANAVGNAYLKQISAERTTEVSGNELNAAFNNQQQLQNVNANGSAKSVLIPAKSDEYSKVSLFAPNAIKLNFRSNGLLEKMETDGRTTILLNAPNGRADASNKKLTADTVNTFFDDGGKNLSKAQAIGNAELYVEPIRASADNYKTTINAARFDCDFFASGNNAKNCSATGGTKTVRVPTVKQNDRGNQTLIANRLNANFDAKTQDIEKFDAVGEAKFSELDRNGISEQINYTASDEFVRLRGGEPTVWDSRARAKASEIDWDTKNNRSALRGKVSTTYYSQGKTGGSTPFGAANSPVFITANDAQFDHKTEVAVYTGNARAWQDNNYVRADKLVLQQEQGRLLAEGTVQSLLYDAKREENGRETNVPVYASADKLVYFNENRLLRYEGNVDIRQSTDRIVAGVANVYLNEKNEVAQTVAEKNVVVTQPKRRASGDYAQYVAADESIVLRGNPAAVEDREQGSTRGAQLTIFLREKRVIGESKTEKTNTGRIRTVYKIGKPKEE